MPAWRARPDWQNWRTKSTAPVQSYGTRGTLLKSGFSIRGTRLGPSAGEKALCRTKHPRQRRAIAAAFHAQFQRVHQLQRLFKSHRRFCLAKNRITHLRVKIAIIPAQRWDLLARQFPALPKRQRTPLLLRLHAPIVATRWMIRA